MELSVIGGSEFALGFMLAGIKDVHVVNDDAKKAIQTVIDQKKAGIVIIDPKTVEALDEKTREVVDTTIEPVFVQVSSEVASDNLRKMIIKSIGVDLMRE